MKAFPQAVAAALAFFVPAVWIFGDEGDAAAVPAAEGDFDISALEVAAGKGVPAAQFELAECYFYGIGVDKNRDTAREWYKKSADGDYVPAQYKLATKYRFDSKIPQPELLRYLYRAACSGDPESQFALAICYYEGVFSTWDYQAAVDWFSAAAKSGHVRAMLYLGICYTWGYGVEQNYDEALWWFRCASDAGDGKAQYFVGEIYRLGRGVPVDLETAKIYYRLSAENGNRYAKLLLSRFGEKERNLQSP